MSIALRDHRVLIVGNPETVHVGHHLLYAAQHIGLEAQIVDVRAAFDAPFVTRQFNWRLRGHRPAHLRAFDEVLLKTCRSFNPTTLIVTGINPPSTEIIRAITSSGVRCVNYLTDDPWNSAHQAPWFMEALPVYSRIYTPRRSNMADLERIGCRVSYLPFAYSPEIHFPESPPIERKAEFECDVLFFGGADKDRIPYIEALLSAGFNVHLYGGYWDRYPSTRRAARGMANPQVLRWAVSCAKVTLCLVRRANRDGHTMRTYEAAAMGACMLVEQTDEHFEIFGRDTDTVLFFAGLDNVAPTAKELLVQPTRREAMSGRVWDCIANGLNRYVHRLGSLIKDQ